MILNPFIYQSGGGGSGPILLVTVTGQTATSVTAVNGGQSVSLAYDSSIGKWWAVLPSTGTWTVTASGGGSTKNTTVSASNVAVYEITLQLGVLPAGYTELQYLETSGTQYIDVGFYSAIRMKANFRLLAWDSNTSENQAFVFGRVSSFWSGNILFLRPAEALFLNGSTTIYRGPVSISLNTDIGIDWNGVVSPPTLSINESPISLTSSAQGGSPITQNCLLFAANIQSGNTSTPTGIHSQAMRCTGPVEFYNPSSTLTAQMYPAKRDSDNFVGMYDIIRNAFYTNAGTGSFIAGPEV